MMFSTLGLCPTCRTHVTRFLTIEYCVEYRNAPDHLPNGGVNMEQKYSFRMTNSITISDDEETRKSKSGTVCEVTYVYDNWTAQELANRLMVSNSPRVAVQALLRKMSPIPSTYTYHVPKAGQRAQVDLKSRLISIFGIDEYALLEEQFGSAEEIVAGLKMLNNK